MSPLPLNDEVPLALWQPVPIGNSITESNAIGFDTEQLTIDVISLRETGEPGDNTDSAL